MKQDTWEWSTAISSRVTHCAWRGLLARLGEACIEGALLTSLLLFYSKRSYKNPLGLKVQHKVLTQGKGPQIYMGQAQHSTSGRGIWHGVWTFSTGYFYCAAAGHPEPESNAGVKNKVDKASELWEVTAPFRKRSLASYSTCAMHLNCACCRVPCCVASRPRTTRASKLLSKTGSTWLSCWPSFYKMDFIPVLSLLN